MRNTSPTKEENTEVWSPCVIMSGKCKATKSMKVMIGSDPMYDVFLECLEEKFKESASADRPFYKKQLGYTMQCARNGDEENMKRSASYFGVDYCVDTDTFFARVRNSPTAMMAYNVQAQSMYACAQKELQDLLQMITDVVKVEGTKVDGKNRLIIFKKDDTESTAMCIGVFDAVALWTNVQRLLMGMKPIPFNYVDWEAGIISSDIDQHYTNSFNETSIWQGRYINDIKRIKILQKRAQDNGHMVMSDALEKQAKALVNAYVSLIGTVVRDNANRKLDAAKRIVRFCEASARKFIECRKNERQRELDKINFKRKQKAEGETKRIVGQSNPKTASPSQKSSDSDLNWRNSTRQVHPVQKSNKWERGQFIQTKASI